MISGAMLVAIWVPGYLVGKWPTCSNLKGFEKVSRNLTKDYLTSFFSLGEATYPAIGLGKDIRGFNEQLTASALIWNKETIHASGFTLDSSERGSSYRRRQQEMIYQKIF